jgi:hypothetical protein
MAHNSHSNTNTNTNTNTTEPEPNPGQQVVPASQGGGPALAEELAAAVARGDRYGPRGVYHLLALGADPSRLLDSRWMINYPRLSANGDLLEEVPVNLDNALSLAVLHAEKNKEVFDDLLDMLLRAGAKPRPETCLAGKILGLLAEYYFYGRRDGEAKNSRAEAAKRRREEEAEKLTKLVTIISQLLAKMVDDLDYNITQEIYLAPGNGSDAQERVNGYDLIGEWHQLRIKLDRKTHSHRNGIQQPIYELAREGFGARTDFTKRLLAHRLSEQQLQPLLQQQPLHQPHQVLPPRPLNKGEQPQEQFEQLPRQQYSDQPDQQFQQQIPDQPLGQHEDKFMQPLPEQLDEQPQLQRGQQQIEGTSELAESVVVQQSSSPPAENMNYSLTDLDKEASDNEMEDIPIDPRLFEDFSW